MEANSASSPLLNGPPNITDLDIVINTFVKIANEQLKIFSEFFAMDCNFKFAYIICIMIEFTSIIFSCV